MEELINEWDKQDKHKSKYIQGQLNRLSQTRELSNYKRAKYESKKIS